MAGPFSAQDCENIITSGIAVILKKTPGKGRVIVDMSSPTDAEQLPPRELTHVVYASIEVTAHRMHHLGVNCRLAKLDIKEAYRIILVHPEDMVFQGICWNDSVYVDCQLLLLVASTIKVYLAGLSFFHILADPTCDLPTFCTPYVNLTIRGIRRVNAAMKPSQICHHSNDEEDQRFPGSRATQLRECAGLGHSVHEIFWEFSAEASFCPLTTHLLTLGHTYAHQACATYTRMSITTLKSASKPQRPISSARAQQSH